MDACGAVEKDLDRVITKFTGIRSHSERVISDITTHFEELRESIGEGNHFWGGCAPRNRSTTFFLSVSFFCFEFINAISSTYL